VLRAIYFGLRRKRKDKDMCVHVFKQCTHYERIDSMDPTLYQRK